MSRYPSEVELDKIENWDGTPRELIQFIADIWEYNQNDWQIRNGRDLMNKKVYKVNASTWGWSGNEDIIRSLEGTWFDFMFSWSWHRGGHYEWQISPTMIDRPDMGGSSWGKIRRKDESDATTE